MTSLDMTLQSSASSSELKVLCSNLRDDLNNFHGKRRTSIQEADVGISTISREAPWETVPPRYTKKEKIANQSTAERPLNLGYATVARLQAEPDAAQIEGIEEWKTWYENHKSRPLREWTKNMEDLAAIFSKSSSSRS